MKITGLSYDDGPECDGWRVGLKRKLGDENVKLLFKYTAQKDTGS
jgi:hypothetical protein